MLHASWSKNEKAWFIEEWGAFQDPDEWEDYGFSLSEAIEWSQWDIEPGVADLYRKDGILNPPDHEFSQYGFDVEDAIEWINMGFDLSSAVEWSDWDVEPDEAANYKEKGIIELPSEHFRDEGVSLEDALKWVSSGFEDFDEAWLWIEWNVTPQDAKQFKDAGHEPPDEEFREAGLSVEDAMQWEIHGFSSSEFENPIDEKETYWKYWHDAGLKPEKAKFLYSDLVEYIENEFQDELEPRNKRNYSYFGRDRKTQLEILTSECIATLAQLNNAGMQVNAENMVKWRGFTSEMILAAIDNGIEPDVAFALGEDLATPQGLELHALLKSMDSEKHIDWALRWKFTVADVQALKKKKINFHDFVMATILGQLNAHVLLKYAKAKWPVLEKVVDLKAQTIEYVVAEWVNGGLEPRAAYPYFVAGFSSQEAKAWLDSGVGDPKIAKRRQDAGLKPK